MVLSTTLQSFIMSTLSILYKRILANASKVSNLPAIEDETQVR